MKVCTALSKNYSSHLTTEATYQTTRVTYFCLKANGPEVLVVTCHTSLKLIC